MLDFYLGATINNYYVLNNYDIFQLENIAYIITLYFDLLLKKIVLSIKKSKSISHYFEYNFHDKNLHNVHVEIDPSIYLLLNLVNNFDYLHLKDNVNELEANQKMCFFSFSLY